MLKTLTVAVFHDLGFLMAVCVYPQIEESYPW